MDREVPIIHLDSWFCEDLYLYRGDSLDLYSRWEKPIVIISDGPYGLNSYPGDPVSVVSLPEIYRPHIAAWSNAASPLTTLWFWNSELGWATIHPLLEAAGWEYRNCHIWDKGIGHIAGNSNSKTLRKLPVTTEVCVQYVRRALFNVEGIELNMREWLRYEWQRTGLPFKLTNEASGVKNAATRKYFTSDHLWYYPPPEAFRGIVEYANERGNPEGKPYFSIDGQRPITSEEWSRMRAKFNFKNGVTNVWRTPAVRTSERVRNESGVAHMNQKPLKLTKLLIELSSDVGDVVWDPFAGLMTTAIASKDLDRKCFATEILPDYFEVGVNRVEEKFFVADQLALASASV